ncbi:MAG: hypothetical protein ACM3N9_07490 [Syntrophothermus sp.]
MKNIFCLLLLLPVLLSGCKEKDEVQAPPAIQNPNYLLSDECAEWVIFKPGSWWIYKNEQKQTTDCTYFKHGPYLQEINYNDGKHQSQWFYVTSDFLLRYGLVGAKGGNLMGVWKKNYTRMLTSLSQEALPDSVVNGTFKNENVHETNSSYILIEKLPVYSLNGKSYNNVIHTKIQYYNSFREFFWAKHVGLLRLREQLQNSDTTWSLVRYKVNQ